MSNDASARLDPARHQALLALRAEADQLSAQRLTCHAELVREIIEASVVRTTPRLHRLEHATHRAALPPELLAVTPDDLNRNQLEPFGPLAPTRLEQIADVEHRLAAGHGAGSTTTGLPGSKITITPPPPLSWV